MTERDRLEILLKEVKYKIEILNAIEERLMNMRGLVRESMAVEILEAERKEIQKEINNMKKEIEMLEMDSTLES